MVFSLQCLAVWCLIAAVSAQSMLSDLGSAPAHRVVIVCSYNPTDLWTDSELTGILGALEERFDLVSEVHVEYMDARTPRDQAYFDRFHEGLRAKYGNGSVDLVLGLDNVAFDYLRGRGREVFRDMPIVFCGVEGFKDEWLEGDSQITGIAEGRRGNWMSVAMGLALFPETERIFVVSESDDVLIDSPAEIEVELIRRVLGTESGLGWNELCEEVSKVEVPSIIFLHAVQVNENGKNLDYRTMIARLNSYGHPIFVGAQRFMGHGALGGEINSGVLHGEKAVDLALRVFDGTAPHAIPVESDVVTQLQFDYVQMKRFGLSLDDVPDRALILNQPINLYWEYRIYFGMALVFIALQAVTIVLLVLSNRRRKAIQLSLEEAKAKAEEANHAKTEFLAIMSHELRTPMNAILGFSELLALEEDDGNKRFYTDLIQSSGKQLMYLIENLLNYTNYSRGKIEVRPELCDTSLEFEFLVESFRAKAKDGPVSIRLERENLPGELRFDWPKLREVTGNLIENALKFSREGVVTVKVQGRTGQADRFELRCCVSDEGPGIPEERRKSIFDPFTQVDSSDTREYAGVGLGLAICSRLVEAMGGQIECRSEVGKGTSFEVTIPVSQVLEAFDRPEELVQSKSEESKRLRIIGAEDVESNELVLAGILDSLGYEAVFVNDGARLIDALKKDVFDVVLMDLQMPNVSGIDATRAIRAGEAGETNRRIPIVGISAHAGSVVKSACLEAGMDAVISKPIDSIALQKELDRRNEELGNCRGKRGPAV